MIYFTGLEFFKIVLDCRSLMISADCRDKLVFTFPRFEHSQWGIGKSKQTFGVHTGEHGRLLLEQWVAARQHSPSGQSASSQGSFHHSRLRRSSARFGPMRALPGQSPSMEMSLKTLYRLYWRGWDPWFAFQKKIVHRLIVLKFSLGSFQSKATF